MLVTVLSRRKAMSSAITLMSPQTLRYAIDLTLTFGAHKLSLVAFVGPQRQLVGPKVKVAARGQLDLIAR